MDVAILVHRLDEPRGAERSQLTLARTLHERGHTVSIVGETGVRPPTDGDLAYRSLGLRRDPNDGDGSWKDELPWKLRICLRGWPVLRDIAPDLVIAQHHTTVLAGWYASRNRVPYVAFYHWNQRVGPRLPFDRSPTRLVREVVDALDSTTLHVGYSRADVSIVTSHFARRQWGESLPGRVEVVHPFIPERSDAPRFGGEYVLHVTPNQQKGIDVTLAMAETMPDEQFVVVGWAPEPSIRRRMDALQNVEYRGYVHDMGHVYRNARAVVAPSSAVEAAGMVPVEAGLYGTPALVSGRGGLAEMAPDHSVVDSTDAEAYVRQLRQLDADYAGYCRKAHEYANSRTAGPQFDRFHRIVRTYCGIEL